MQRPQQEDKLIVFTGQKGQHGQSMVREAEMRMDITPASGWGKRTEK